jgi:predicted DNA-binding transcriptional regulator YafY
MAAIPKTERILNLISFLLKSRQPVSWRRIRQEVEGYNDPAERDGSVERRFERDKPTLRELGIAVQHAPRLRRRGGGEGYCIEPGSYFPPQVELTPRGGRHTGRGGSRGARLWGAGGQPSVGAGQARV